MGITHSTSEKEGQTLRLCVDYLRLNAVSEFEAYMYHIHVPRIEDLLDLLGESTITDHTGSGKGLLAGAWKRICKRQDRFYYSFWAIQFTRMPFRLSGAPATFQQLMDRVLQGHENYMYAAAYLDDLVIHSETWEDHLEHISAVLMALREAGTHHQAEKMPVHHG